MYREMAEKVRPPRVAHVRFPFGRPMGEPNNPDQQRVVAEDALRLLETATEPGTVVTLPYRWRREDYARIRRERLLRSARS
jgi:D-proline reductase (dithiol) PrdB